MVVGGIEASETSAGCTILVFGVTNIVIVRPAKL